MMHLLGGQGRQTMPGTRLVALFIAGLDLAAGRRTLRVGGAGDLLPDHAMQGNAARRCLIGARHAAMPGIHLLGQSFG